MRGSLFVIAGFWGEIPLLWQRLCVAVGRRRSGRGCIQGGLIVDGLPRTTSPMDLRKDVGTCVAASAKPGNEGLLTSREDNLWAS